MNNNNYPRAKQVIWSLIQGVDPQTTKELPPETIFNRVDVVRALLASVDAIEQVTARAARRAQLPSGVGQHWTEEEEQRLKEAFAKGDAISDIAQRHNRTVRAIEARLERIGLLAADQRTTHNSFTGAPTKRDTEVSWCSFSGIANAAFIWALILLLMWHGSTDVRIALAGIYFGVGTVAIS